MLQRMLRSQELTSLIVADNGGKYMAEIDVNQMVLDALKESTTRVGKLDPNQMQLMSNTLNTAAGIYGNQLTAESNRGIGYINQQTVDLAKKNNLNFNAPAAPGIGVPSRFPQSSGNYPVGTPEQLNSPNPSIMLARDSDEKLPNKTKGGIINFGDINKRIDEIMGGK